VAAERISRLEPVPANDARIPPHDVKAEMAVLAAINVDPNLLDDTIDILKPERFYSEANRRIFEAYLALHEANRPIDVVNVLGWLNEHGRLAQVGQPYFLEMLNASPAIVNVRSHAEIVHDCWRRREMLTATMRYQAEAYFGGRDTQEVLSEAAQAFSDIAVTDSAVAMQTIGKCATDAYARIVAAGQAGREILGLATGYERFDRLTSGLHGGDITIAAGRPGMGKTSWMLGAAVNAVSDDKLAEAVVFSLEMPREQLGLKATCSEARVDVVRMRRGALSPTEWSRVTNAAAHLNNLPLWIDDKPSITLSEVRAKTRKLANEARARGRTLKLVCVDYLQLMGSHSGRSREEEVSAISRGLKALAKEASIPVIALSQLNRALEARADKRPQLSDLRESGAIEQDADNVVFIHREDYYKPDAPERGIAELIIAKQRNGPTGIVKLRWDGQHTRFDNLADGEYETNEGDRHP
jgi:replicative DNA helicase